MPWRREGNERENERAETAAGITRTRLQLELQARELHHREAEKRGVNSNRADGGLTRRESKSNRTKVAAVSASAGPFTLPHAFLNFSRSLVEFELHQSRGPFRSRIRL